MSRDNAHSGPKVAIRYGVATGENNGKRLRPALREAGYRLVTDATQADIIIGHSAGCFELPTAPTHQKLLLVNPPYWPGRTPSERGRRHLWSHLHYYKHNYAFVYWLARSWWAFYYIIRDYRRTRWIFSYVHQYDLATAIHNHTAILVRNHEDNWLTPELEELAAANPKLVVKHLPGEHDDILYNPEKYLALLDELAAA